MKLSVIMITINGEDLIEKSLRSILPFCDECFVCDTGSTDNTLSILEKLKKEFPHLNIISKNIQSLGDKKFSVLTEILNELKGMCGGKWILRIDDDEIFPHGTIKEIMSVSGDEIAYSIPFLHYERGGFINPKAHLRPGFYATRLVKNIPEIRWVNDWGSKPAGEVVSYGGKKISARGFQVGLCRKLINPFLHLGELRKEGRRHKYSFHEVGHCSIPLGEYAKYI